MKARMPSSQSSRWRWRSKAPAKHPYRTLTRNYVSRLARLIFDDMPNPKKVDQSPGVIAFRIDPETEQILAARAAALGMSRNLLARRCVMEVLEESEERAALRVAVQALNGNLTQFRDEFIFATEALLASAGKVKEGDARAWIDEHFK
jgi:hypothetical protein